MTGDFVARLVVRCLCVLLLSAAVATAPAIVFFTAAIARVLIVTLPHAFQFDALVTATLRIAPKI